MLYKCCICGNLRQDAILHHFPSCEKRQKKWLVWINRDDLKSLTPTELSKLGVCQKHFEKKFITPKYRLLGYAYPTLFTDGEKTSGIPTQQEHAENVDPQIDHNYSRKRRFDHTYCSMEPLKEIPTNTTAASSHPAIEHTEQNTGIVASGSRDIQNSSVPSCSASVRNSGLERIWCDKHPKASRQRLISKLRDLSPTCKTIYQEYQKAKKQTNFYKRAKRAMKFSKEKAFERITKNMNTYAARILKMQMNLCTKGKQGRRFTTEEKLIALAIMKQSPKGYRFLKKIFILPSKVTLNKMVAKLKIQTGICPQVFDLLKKEVAAWNEKKKFCSIIFDEMSLDTGLTYDKNKDIINGFVELNEKKNQFADHALVFMLRGAFYKWQQPVAFYYCEGSTSGIELKAILKEVVAAIVKCGLRPIVLACDQGASFRSALNSLKEDTKRDQILANQEPDGTVTISGANLNIIYDPSHLIKGIRNNFLSKNIKLDGKISKWSDIVDVYETDCHHTETRILHKLNDQHVIPEKIKKMKVKNCVKVLSYTMSAALSYTAKFSHYVDGRPVSPTLSNTADVVLFFDKLFDSVNGATLFSKKSKGKVLRTAVTEKSSHHEFWKQAIEVLKRMKFVDSSGKEKTVPSIQNFITTLKSYMRLWQFSKNQEMKIMRPRYFNSDPIENFFGQVRAYNYRNVDPNCHSFNCTFKSLLITRIIKFHNDTFNCEDDPADQVINLKNLFNEEENFQLGHPEAGNIEMIIEQARRERINVHSRAYTAGWVVRKILNKTKIKCIPCKNSLTTTQSNVHDWISCREYNSARKSLSYPSEGAVRCFSTVVTDTNEYLEKNPHKDGLSEDIKAIILSKYSFDFIECTEHKDLILNHFIIITIKFIIMNWCSVINRILKGTDIKRLNNNNLPAMQHKAYEKYKKKLKNKSLNK